MLALNTHLGNLSQQHNSLSHKDVCASHFRGISSGDLFVLMVISVCLFGPGGGREGRKEERERERVREREREREALINETPPSSPNTGFLKTECLP